MRRSGIHFETLWPMFVQICKFGAVGVLNNIISLTVYYVVIYFNSTMYLLGNALGFLVSTLNSYLLNSRFVFKTDKSKGGSSRKMLAKTYVVYACSLGISTGLLFLLVQIIGVSERAAPIYALMVTVPFNYMMNKLWVYQEKAKKRG